MPKKMPIDEAVRASMAEGRVRLLENCADLLAEAADGFGNGRFPRACFLAMTAIEEAGKLAVLRFFAHAQAQKIGIDPQDVDLAALSEFLRGHPEKAREAATWSLEINAGADRRHGVHPASGVRRTSGLMLLVRSGEWMNTRNACLYVDLQFRPPKLTFPGAAVSKALAFYMICMAYEVVAEQGASAIENVEGSLDFEQEQIANLKEFMNAWDMSSEMDALSFLSEPERFRHATVKRENGRAKKTK